MKRKVIDHLNFIQVNLVNICLKALYPQLEYMHYDVRWSGLDDKSYAFVMSCKDGYNRAVGHSKTGYFIYDYDPLAEIDEECNI